MRQRPASLPMPAWALRSFALVALAAAAITIATSARAEMKPLSEVELSGVRGQAQAPDVQGTVGALPIAGPLLKLLSPKDMQLTQLDGAAFQAALKAHGLPEIDRPLWDGQPVMQMEVTGGPVSATFEASSLLGVAYHGPSMGTISINNLDARGTTLWVWTHH